MARREKVTGDARTTASGAPSADYGTVGINETIDVRVPDIGDFKDVRSSRCW